MTIKNRVWFISGLLVLSVCGTAQADWVQLDGGINYSQTAPLGAPRLGVAVQSPAEDVAYAVTTEKLAFFPRNTRVYVYHWNNADWLGVTATGTVLNYAIDQFAAEPALDVINNSGTHQVAVAWSEMDGGYSRIFVKRWSTGASWQFLPQATPTPVWINRNSNQHANNPSIALPKPDPTRPFVAWQEVAATGGVHICVKAYNGTDWVYLPNSAQPVGEPLNRTATSVASLPQIAMGTDDRPVVAWQEEIISPLNSDIYVSRWNGTDWVPLGGGLRDNAGVPATSPWLVVDTLNRPWVAFLEGVTSATDVKVKRFNGVGWEQVGNVVLAGASVKKPTLALVSNQDVFLSLLDTSGVSNQVRVYAFSGSNWLPLGGSLNVDPGNSADIPHLAIRDGQPIVIWPEGTPNTYTPHVFIKQWVPPTPTPSPTAGAGPTLTPTPPPSVRGLSVNTVLAYPNPASQQMTFGFYADSGSGQAMVRLYNTHYRLVAQASGTATDGRGSITLDVSGIAQGVYFFQAVVNGKKLPMGKVVVAR